MIRDKNRKRSSGHILSSLIIIVLIIFLIKVFNNTPESEIVLAFNPVFSKQDPIFIDPIEHLVLKESVTEVDQGDETVEPVEEPVEEPVQEVVTASTIRHKDLRVFEDIDSEQMNAWIDELTKYNTDSPFRGRGDVFIKASEESGLDPRYILAHAAIESGWGTSNLAKTKHNYFGIAAYDSNPGNAYSMGDELDSGIVNGAKWIAENYTNQGQYTLHLMIYGKKQYATAADSWINGIASIMIKCI